MHEFPPLLTYILAAVMLTALFRPLAASHGLLPFLAWIAGCLILWHFCSRLSDEASSTWTRLAWMMPFPVWFLGGLALLS